MGFGAKFLAPSFGLAQSQLLCHLGSDPEDERSLSKCLSACLSGSLFSSPIIFLKYPVAKNLPPEIIYMQS